MDDADAPGSELRRLAPRCPHCGGREPTLGTDCPLCGRPLNGEYASRWLPSFDGPGTDRLVAGLLGVGAIAALAVVVYLLNQR